MKRLFSILLAVMLVAAVTGCSKITYTMILPQREAVSDILIEKNGDERRVEQEENIKVVLNILNGAGRSTQKPAGAEKPEVEGLLHIAIQAEEITELYIYSDGKGGFIEIPNSGKYEITAEEFESINSFYDELKQPVSELDRTSIKNAVKKLSPLDQRGKSFKPEELTNRELLRYAFLQFNPKGNGFTNISFESLARTYIKGSFGIEDAVREDIVCSCGQTMAVYNSVNDIYTWDEDFHYLDHKSEAFNEIKDMYMIEDRLIVELYKIFPDLMMNSSPKQFNFYPTYSAAARQKNPLFTVTDEREFTEAVNTLDDGRKTKYRLTFVREGTLKLIDYRIEK